MDNWIVYKFGGTSMGSATKIASVAEIISTREYFINERIAVIVSAMSGVTDALIKLSQMALERNTNLETHLNNLFIKHITTAQELLPSFHIDNIIQKINIDFLALKDILRGVSLVRECSERTLDYISGLGEVWSAIILSEYLLCKNFSAVFTDARDILVVEPSITNPIILWKDTEQNMHKITNTKAEIIVITGFICKTKNDIPTTLGRNGSDYSASIFGNLLNAREIVIWTDVDGVLSADPRRVKDALVVPEMTYCEAVELANFGAKVLHPGTMIPAVAKNIPILIKNTFKPFEAGSKIHLNLNKNDNFYVKGCTSVDEISILSIETTEMLSLASLASRMFSALNEKNIRIITATLGSPGQTLTCTIHKNQGFLAKEITEKIFINDKRNGDILSINLEQNKGIIAIVGDKMKGKTGIASNFFNSLANADVNVCSISQGSAERNIGVVINSADINKALKSVHAGFYLSAQTLSVGIIGTGNVANSLLKQLNTEINILRKELCVDIRIRAIANSSKMLLEDKEIDLNNWKEHLYTNGTDVCLTMLLEHIKSDSLPHVVFIDCTDSMVLANKYPSILSLGIHIITSNKSANSTNFELYDKLREITRTTKRHYLYESSICSGLPIIETLADIVETGDKLYNIEGIFSSQISYLFTKLNEGKLFSKIINDMKQDPLYSYSLDKELHGEEILHRVLIIAREAKLKIEQQQISIQNLFISGLNIEQLDKYYADLITNTKQNNEILHYVGVINLGGLIEIKLKTYPINHPFAHLNLGDNIVLFSTKRHTQNSLIVQGAGIGADATAGAVFADLLRLTRYLGAMG